MVTLVKLVKPLFFSPPLCADVTVAWSLLSLLLSLQSSFFLWQAGLPGEPYLSTHRPKRAGEVTSHSSWGHVL